MTRRPGAPRPDEYWLLLGLAQVLAAVALVLGGVALVLWAA